MFRAMDVFDVFTFRVKITHRTPRWNLLIYAAMTSLRMNSTVSEGSTVSFGAIPLYIYGMVLYRAIGQNTIRDTMFGQ